VWSISGDQFRMADGARVLGHEADTVSVQVDMPTDERGFIGRQCPDCSQLFRVDGDDYEALPDGLELWCVYCGHRQSTASSSLSSSGPNGLSRTWRCSPSGGTLDRSFRRLTGKSGNQRLEVLCAEPSDQ
jgi:hypothetical protein